MDAKDIRITDKKEFGTSFKSATDLNSMLVQVSKNADAVSAALEAQDIDVGLVDAALTTINADLLFLHGEVNDLSGEIDTLETSIGGFDGRITAVENGLTQTNQTVSTLSGSVTDVVNAEAAQNTAISALQNRQYTNKAGQARVNYTGLTLINFINGVNKTFDIGAAGVSVSPPPTTLWPRGSVDYNTSFYVANRLRENPAHGQVHKWRIIGTYANKSQSNNGALIIELYNPSSGFTANETITLPDGPTGESFTAEILTIADNASLAVGQGYQLRARTSFSDNNFLLTINSIVRVSEAMEVSVV